ncbi:MAG TPA: putative DNA-binding domain-containing protein [Gammaproteobacteria bacterium]|nr:putative DNA-binding domain-containing protein [Gammaproteobacteria bacterium]
MPTASPAGSTKNASFMPSLAETQSAIADAVLAGDPRLAPPALIGGHDPRARFGIHIRHYQTSLRRALCEKFPATAWLLGSNFVSAAAAAYARECPPAAPCIAEYGSTFPAFVARLESARLMPYVESFALLEWALGHAAIAVDESAVGWEEFAGMEPARLLDTHLELQAGVDYLRATHPVDDLVRVFLSGEEPVSLELPRTDTLIEVRGSRGSFSMNRLDAGTFAFRTALASGKAIGAAAGGALDVDHAFDAGRALRDLIGRKLVVSIRIDER